MARNMRILSILSSVVVLCACGYNTTGNQFTDNTESVDDAEVPLAGSTTDKLSLFVGDYEDAEKDTVNITKTIDGYNIYVYINRMAYITGNFTSGDDTSMTFECTTEYDESASVVFSKVGDSYTLKFLSSNISGISAGESFDTFYIAESENKTFDKLEDGTYFTSLNVNNLSPIKEEEMFEWACANIVSFEGDTLKITASFEFYNVNNENYFILPDTWLIYVPSDACFEIGGDGGYSTNREDFQDNILANGSEFGFEVEDGVITNMFTYY